jgi:DNA-binding CsgD family transcriptional regulator
MTDRFVGRAAELTVIDDLLASSAGGQGHLVALSGDAGSGKSRFLAQCARLARGRNHQVLWSHAIEDAKAPPYQPWVAILRPLLRSRPAEPEHPANLPDVITQLLLAAAGRAPLVLLFDNLDAADQASLLLLESLSHQIEGLPVLIVATYRAAALSGSHPQRSTLARMVRATAHRAIELKGLSAGEVGELLRAQLQVPIPGIVARTIHERTDGNALFVVEAARMLASVDRAELLRNATSQFYFPESLRDMVDARLQTLPPPTQALLRVAAVQGRDFELAPLCELAGTGVRAAAKQLDPAIVTGIVVRVRPGHYRFDHALHREVLYADLDDEARQALHLQAAEHLVRRHQHDPEPWLSRIAHHYFESAAIGAAERAVHYCVATAEAAAARKAHDEAAAAYEQALQAADLDPGTSLQRRFELLLLLGTAQYRSGQLSGAASNLLKSALLAQRHGWWPRLTDAVIAFQTVYRQLGEPHIASIPLHRLALRYAPPAAEAPRARLLGSLATAYHLVGDQPRARAALHEGIELARRCADAAVLFGCLERSWNVLTRTGEQRERLALAEEAVAIARAAGNPEMVLEAIKLLPFPLADLGQVGALERVLPEFRHLAIREQHPHHLNIATGFETALAILQGRWPRAMDLARRGLEQSPVQGIGGLDGRYGFQVFTIRRLQGGLQGVAPLLDHITARSAGGGLWLPGQILLNCELGRFDEARALMRRLDDPPTIASDDLELITLVYLAESAVVLRVTRRCAQIYERLIAYRGLNANLQGVIMVGAVSGYLALLAERLNHHRLARELFEEALAQNASMGAGPALARTQVDYAELLLDGTRPDRDRADALLHTAAVAAAALRLAPLAARIESLRAPVLPRRLSARELTILRRVAEGESNQQIAGNLHISHSTVATHLRSILRKTGARNRTEAVAFARQRNLLAEP